MLYKANLTTVFLVSNIKYVFVIIIGLSAYPSFLTSYFGIAVSLLTSCLFSAIQTFLHNYNIEIIDNKDVIGYDNQAFRFRTKIVINNDNLNRYMSARKSFKDKISSQLVLYAKPNQSIRVHKLYFSSDVRSNLMDHLERTLKITLH